ncbi:MAG: hypothetical protein MUD12_08305 [Spirochaetes bacterium]|nr:hypothetical protein [Spirochaetota bacterium]
MKTTRGLAASGDYYRAQVELLRLNSYFPGFIDGIKFETSGYHFLFNGGRHSDLASRCGGGLNFNFSRIYCADSFAALGQYEKSLEILNFRHGASDHVIGEMRVKRLILSYIMLGRIESVSSAAVNPGDRAKYLELVEYSRKHGGVKSPVVAGFLGVLPGGGYVYSGNYLTGVLAAIVVSLSSFLTYYAFHTKNYAIGTFVGAAGTFFYGGSILGGIMAARKNNLEKNDKLRDHLSEKMDLKGDRDYIYGKYGIGGNDGK